MSKSQVAVWFEIPAANFERAVTFYQTLFATTLRQEVFNEEKVAVFPYQPPTVSGCIVQGSNYRPGPDGAVIYLNADGRLDELLVRVVAIGGKVIAPRTALPSDMGFYAHIADSEGNRIGLHSCT